MLLLYIAVIIWPLLEASLWWVAPDISISIAYIYFPQHWRRFVLLALCGVLLGTAVTYTWAQHAGYDWLQYVTALRFHSWKNILYVQSMIDAADPSSIIKGSWRGIPYKLFIGVAAIKGISFAKITLFGMISRALRFMFVLGITVLIRHYTKPWSTKHPSQLAVILLLIWGSMILLFGIVVNPMFV